MVDKYLGGRKGGYGERVAQGAGQGVENPARRGRAHLIFRGLLAESDPDRIGMDLAHAGGAVVGIEHFVIADCVLPEFSAVSELIGQLIRKAVLESANDGGSVDCAVCGQE